MIVNSISQLSLFRISLTISAICTEALSCMKTFSDLKRVERYAEYKTLITYLLTLSQADSKSLWRDTRLMQISDSNFTQNICLTNFSQLFVCTFFISSWSCDQMKIQLDAMSASFIILHSSLHLIFFQWE